MLIVSVVTLFSVYLLGQNIRMARSQAPASSDSALAQSKQTITSPSFFEQVMALILNGFESIIKPNK